MKFTHYAAEPVALPLSGDHFFPLIRDPHFTLSLHAQLNRHHTSNAVQAALVGDDAVSTLLPRLTLSYEVGPDSTGNEWVAVVEDVAAQLGCDEVHVWSEKTVSPHEMFGMFGSLNEIMQDVFNVKATTRQVVFSLSGHRSYPKMELE